MKTIREKTEADLRERGSRFIAKLLPSPDEEAFTRQLNALRQEFYDASHHCYAYRINPHQIREFSSDDGEPSGTAGLPILNQLKSFDVINAGLVVIRYFGGTKLGKAGLIESYGGAAAQCLSHAKLEEILLIQRYKIDYSYDQENLIQKLFMNFELHELQAEYLARVTKEIGCSISDSAEFEKAISALAHLDIGFEKLTVDFIPAS